MRRPLVLLIFLLTALAPAAAHAQSPVTPPATSPPPPVEAQLTLKVERVGGARATALTGSSVLVRGTTTAFAAGQTVIVRFYERGRKRGARRVTLGPGPAGTGAFVLSYRPASPGPLSIRAFHDPTPQLGGLAARATTIDVLPRRVAPRSGRASIRALQRRLKRLGYVTGRSGAFDGRTARAVLAFRKVTGMARTTNASVAVMRALARGKGTFKVRFPQHGRHIEGDLSRQVLALIDKGRAVRIYHTSSGAPATPTILGSFRVYLKTPGTNGKGMVDSAYFIRGYATHGYPSVPIYPASHGCFRLPIPDARTVFNWIKIGTPVDVYR
ncbi:MAG: L,D-transpeptidase family protein [Solirubrobacteraceae bacterium]|nr:L,D-transpeptidase family protein [Solirubrobacteraceae bacterium]